MQINFIMTNGLRVVKPPCVSDYNGVVTCRFICIDVWIITEVQFWPPENVLQNYRSVF